MKYWILFTLYFFIFFGYLPYGNAQELPKLAYKYLPILKNDIDTLGFPTQYKESMAGQVEQESCISIKSKLCWNPHVELKTSRELGVGVGQLTIAYNSNGSVRFNAFSDAVHQYKQLHNWSWQDRFDPKMQFLALILKDQSSFEFMKFPTANYYEHLAMALVGYNGGMGSVLQDRKLCMTIQGCDPTRWFGNIEKYSRKSKITMRGYGQSPFQISREYPINILKIRMSKYAPYIN